MVEVSTVKTDRVDIFRAWRNLYRVNLRLMRALVSVVLVVALWEFVGRYVVKEQVFFVPLSSILGSGWELALSGELLRHTQLTLLEFFIGFVSAVGVGIIVGLAMGVSKPVRDYSDHWVSAFYAMPIVVLTPIFILVFGFGLASKVVIVFLTVVFPVIINTNAGVLAADQELIEAARSFGARPIQIFVKVLLPSALAFIVAGMRLGVARGLVGVVFAEMIGAKAGLGYMAIVAATTFDTQVVFLTALIIAVFGVAGVELLKKLEARLAPWKHFELRL